MNLSWRILRIKWRILRSPMPKEHPVYIECHYTCQPFYPWVKGSWPCARGSNFLCVNVFPIVKLHQGNFQGDVRKNKRIFYDSSWGKFYGLIRGSNFLCVNVFPIVKLHQGNFQGDVRKNKRIFYDSSWGKFYGLIRTQSGSTINQSWESEMYQTVEVTCYIPTMFILAIILQAKPDLKIDNKTQFWALLWIFLHLIDSKTH